MQDAQARARLAGLDHDLIEQRVREVIRLRMEGRRSEADAYYGPGFVFEAVGPGCLRPWTGRFDSPEAMAQMRRDLMVEFELIDHAILDLAVTGEICLVRRRATYRNRGMGRPETFCIWERYRFEDGLIVEITHQADPVALARLTGRLHLLAEDETAGPGPASEAEG